MASCKKSIPRNKSPNPAKERPNSPQNSLPKSWSIAPTPIIGKAKAVIENFNPKKATIQPVLVVPMLAPIIIPIACTKLNTPALTNPIVAKVVAVDDCTIMVKLMPKNIALMGEPVKRPSHCLKLSPAIAFRLSVIKDMPSKNKPIPPVRCVSTINITINYLSSIYI